MQTSCCHPRGGKGNEAIFYWESGNDGSVGSSQCAPSLPPMALTARSYRSRRVYQPPLATAKAILIPQRQTRASSPARDAHGVMPNSRHVPSREQRSTSRENALCKGFETKMKGLTLTSAPSVGLVLIDNNRHKDCCTVAVVTSTGTRAS